jgi:hypothetical protein
VLVRQEDKDDKVDKGERVCFFVASSRAIAYESEKPTPERQRGRGATTFTK